MLSKVTFSTIQTISLPRLIQSVDILIRRNMHIALHPTALSYIYVAMEMIQCNDSTCHLIGYDFMGTVGIMKTISCF